MRKKLSSRKKLLGSSLALLLGTTLALPAVVKADNVTIDNSTSPNPHTAAISLLDHRTYTLNNTTLYTISGSISGNYSLTFDGTGSIALSGLNTYTEGTILKGGTLVLGHNQTLGVWTGGDPLSYKTGSLIVQTGASTIKTLHDRRITNRFTIGTNASDTGRLTLDIAKDTTLTIEGVANTASASDYANSTGGAIQIKAASDDENDARLKIAGTKDNPQGHLVIKNSSTNGNGGAIGSYFTNSNEHSVIDLSGLQSLTMADNIAGNSGSGDGGGISSYSYSSSSVTLGTNASFTGNIAGNSSSGDGGGISSSSSSSSSSVTLGANASFTGNIAGNSGYGDGGGISSSSFFSSSVTLGDNATFTGNIAGNGSYGDGGGIYSYSDSSSSSVTLGANASFTGNIAGNSGSGSGGGISSYSSSFSSSSVTLGDYATFTDNIAGKGSFGSGGGIYSFSFFSSSVTLGANASFTGNIAGNSGSGSGGGISSSSFSSSSSVTLGAGAYFANNRAGGDNNYGQGGAIYTMQNLTLHGNSYFTGNLASQDDSNPSGGGAVWLEGYGTTNTATLDASLGHIGFSGNYMNVNTTNPANPDTSAAKPNSLYLEKNTLLELKGANNSYFDDPIWSGATGGNSLVKEGTGFVQFAGENRLNTTSFTGTNSVDIKAGTFRLANGAEFDARGAGKFNVAAGATLAGAGTIKSTGGFTISGAIAPDSDRFEIPTYVAKGDTINGATATNYNYFKAARTTLDPNKTIGTLTLDGDVTFNNAAILVDTNATTNDKVVVTGKASIAANSSLSLGTGPSAALTAQTFDFNTTGRLDLTGYTPGDEPGSNRQTVIETTSGITNFNPNVTVNGQASADFLSASAYQDGNNIQVETRLTWDSTDPDRKAHGDFTIDSGEFKLGAILQDKSASTNNRLDWGGNSLTKLGAGTLILTANNAYTGTTTVREGKLQLGDGGTDGSVAGPIDNNGQLVYNRTTDLVQAGAITGSGSLLKTNTNKLELDSVQQNSLYLLEGSLTLTGSLDLSEHLELHGGTSFTQGSSVSTPELRIYSSGSPAAYTGSLDLTGKKLSFYLDPATAAGDTLLTMNGSSLGINESTQLSLHADTLSSLSKGDVITLVDKTTGSFAEDKYQTQAWGGGAKLYDFTVVREQTSTALLATFGGLDPDATAEAAKAYAEGKLAGMNQLHAATELVTNQALANAWQQEAGSNGFFAFGGGKTKAKTGSHIDSDAFNLAGGISHKKQADSHTLLTAVFIEGGWGSYDSYNSFSTGSVHGEGDAKHYGLGILAKRENNKGLYLEGSLRGGRVETDFKTNDMGTGADFDSKSTYWGAHLGLGRALKLKQNDVLDTYLKLFYTRQGSDSVTTGTGERIHFDSADSTRLRLGARYTKQLKERTKYYAGLAWEYEFSGKQKATIDGLRIDAPEMKGSSAIIELGLQHEMSDKWTVDLSATGLLGKREGATGSLNFSYRF